MARMPHEKADARDLAQTLIKFELRRYVRRLAQTAEDHVAIAYDEAMARGLPFDYEAVAREAVSEAQRMYVAGELPAGEASGE